MGDLLNKSIVFAAKAHEGQLRKGSEIPYILHPLEAAAIVATITADEEVLSAAVLHDVIEDTPATVKEIRELFGERVASLVASESENKRDGQSAADTWQVRKEETIKHLKTAPTDVKIITLGDKLSNIRSMYRDHTLIGDDIWQRFNQKNKDRHRWYYESIADCLSELQAYPAYKEYVELVEKTFK